VNKNWPNDVRVNCKFPGNLVKLIDFELDSSQKLIEFEESWDDFCHNPTLAKCGGEAQHLEKLEVGSLPGLLKV